MASDANEVLAKFKAAKAAKAAKEAKLKAKHAGKTALAIPESRSQDTEFEKRRAALLAQAEQNIPAERDLEWEKQLQEDRRSLYFDRDRSIMDDDSNDNEPEIHYTARIQPPNL